MQRGEAGSNSLAPGTWHLALFSSTLPPPLSRSLFPSVQVPAPTATPLSSGLAVDFYITARLTSIRLPATAAESLERHEMTSRTRRLGAQLAAGSSRVTAVRKHAS